MSDDRVEGLIQAFGRSIMDFEQTVRACSKSAWGRVAKTENWTAAALARHIAVGHAQAADWIDTMVAGEAVTLTPDDQANRNAADARLFAATSRADVLKLNESSAARGRQRLQALRADDLDKTAPFGPANGAPLSVETVAGAMIRHIDRHLKSLKDTIEPAT